MPPAADRFSVLGTWIRRTDPERALAVIRGWIASGRRDYVCLVNVHAVMEAHRDPALRAIYNAAGLALPDGMPLVWAAHVAGLGDVRRVYGPDLMLSVCAQAAREGWACYFYGGAPGTGEGDNTGQHAEYERRGAAPCRQRDGERDTAGHAEGACSRPLDCACQRARGGEEARADVARIDAARPEVVFVGLGCPKQERWMAAHREALEAPVLAGVGAAFDFVTGRVPQAPRWMMGLGLEWLFRLVQEPRRLWYRYLVYNPLFVIHFLLQTAGLRRYGPDEPPAG